MDKEIIDANLISHVSEHLYEGVTEIIDKAKQRVAVYVNAQTSMTYWLVGNYIVNDLDYQTYSAYGQKILATLSQTLKQHYTKMGVMPRNLWYMKTFYERYAESDAKVQCAVALLPWSHNLLILSKNLDDTATRGRLLATYSQRRTAKSGN